MLFCSAPVSDSSLFAFVGFSFFVSYFPPTKTTTTITAIKLYNKGISFTQDIKSSFSCKLKDDFDDAKKKRLILKTDDYVICLTQLRDRSRPSQMMVKLNVNQKQEGLLKHWSPWARDSESTSLGWGLKIRILIMFPNDTDVNNQSPPDCQCPAHHVFLHQYSPGSICLGPHSTSSHICTQIVFS